VESTRKTAAKLAAEPTSQIIEVLVPDTCGVSFDL